MCTTIITNLLIFDGSLLKCMDVQHGQRFRLTINLCF